MGPSNALLLRRKDRSPSSDPSSDGRTPLSWLLSNESSRRFPSLPIYTEGMKEKGGGERE